MSQTKRLKLKAPLRGIPSGQTITIRVDRKGVPLDQYWRDRLKDSAIDGCVEIVNETKPASKKIAETKKKGD